ncbi:Mu transposase C-terminal domain-containing protein [Alkalihalobacterium bogoriense]|uniref:Mu transposase C-terminal domain-containing protein n=1 Tax=Alkalihalobacterium bogoriense TaxID=246272 RepID=UPI000686A838|nr:Mu transposase C-terminal domain-containing protein [Alkalihalobacterium bogoriense]
MVISINMLIQYKYDSNRIERVIWINEQYQSCFLVNIFDNSLPFEREIVEIKSLFKNKEIMLVEKDPFAVMHSDSGVSEKALKLQEQSWKVINNLLVNGVGNLLISKERNKLINKVAKDMKISKKSVLKYLKRYWKRGMNKNALLPDFANCGGKGKDKTSGNAKRGRPGVANEGINVDEETKKIIRLAKRKFYEKKTNVSLRFAYEQMLKEFYYNELDESPYSIPTYKQFVYWIKKEQNDGLAVIRRKGKRHFDLNYRPLLSSATSEVRSPLERVQIDSTVADVYLVSEFNRNWIIGRPILYFCKDVWSRMIAGIHVALEGPNFEQARIALMNMVENKKDFCKRYDISIEEEEWPTAHMPSCLVADRAELLSNASNVLTEELNITIENSAPFRGDFKAIVEQHFRLINIQVKPLLPGSVGTDFRKRGVKDYRLEGKLTLKEFTKIIIKCVLYYNNHQVIDQYIRDEEMIQAEIEPIPIRLWNWGIQNRAGKLRTISTELMMLYLLPKERATVTGKGIKFKNIYYSSNLALKEQWFVKARLNGSWKVDVTYDPRNMNYIYLRGIHRDSFEKCFLLDYQARYKFKTFEDVAYLQQHEKVDKQSHKQDELKERIRLIEDVESIVKQAEKLAKNEIVEMSKSSRVKGIKKNRQLEIERMSKGEMLVSVPESYNHSSEHSQQCEDPDLVLFKKMQKKGLQQNE